MPQQAAELNTDLNNKPTSSYFEDRGDATDAWLMYIKSIALGETDDAEATGNGSIIAILKRLRTLLGTGISSSLSQGLPTYVETRSPTVTNGAYTSGDVVGTEMYFQAGPADGSAGKLRSLQLVCSGAIPGGDLRLWFFRTAPVAVHTETITDNAVIPDWKLTTLQAMLFYVDVYVADWIDTGTRSFANIILGDSMIIGDVDSSSRAYCVITTLDASTAFAATNALSVTFTTQAA